jgi:glucose/arabinose dehydrogenase/mono/diheme cytochrome c family protein
MAAAGCRNSHPLPAGDPGNGGLLLPEGFEAVVVADSIGPARHIAINTNGDLYVKLRVTTGDKGNVALRDVDGDGKADSIVRFGDYPNDGSLATEMKIHEGYLYFSSEKVLYRQQLIPGQLIPESKPEVILTDDHPHGSHWHITKPVAFDDKGHFYVPFGAPSNACQDLVHTPGGNPGIQGLYPCPELEQHGGIWQFESGKLGQTQKDGKRIATGLRSIVGLNWSDRDRHLFAVVHGRDDLHLLWPEKFSAWQSALLPAEVLVRVDSGDDYGWPYAYFDPLQQRYVQAPEYGGDGKMPPRVSGLKDPAQAFPGHWAPNDLLFYSGDQFPERYKEGVFIAFHGSTNRAPYPQSGYFVCFVPFRGGKPYGDWEVFANGFAGVDPIVNVSDARYRPMGLAMGPDGSMYVVDSRKGKIWRILYKGNKKNFSSDALMAMEKEKRRSNIRTPDSIADNLYKDTKEPGALTYITYCRACHQLDGRGDGSRYPPLERSEWVTGSKDRLLDIVMNGLNKPIEVNGKAYNNIMPGHGFLSDRELAEVLTYIRTHFANQAAPITEKEVSRFRRSKP